MKPANSLIAKHVQRIDNFLLSNFKHLAKEYIYRIIRSGEVRVNSKRVKPKDKVQINDIVRLPPQCKLLFKKRNPDLEQAKIFLQETQLFDNQNLLIINKPSGIAVHGGSMQTSNVIDVLRTLFADLQLAHRLDKETSGCLVLAKNRETLISLQKSWVNKQIVKIYLAFVYGIVEKEFIIDDAILRLHGKNMHGSVLTAEGKGSVTKIIPLKYYKSNNVSLVEVHPYTGRMHQIRVHLASYALPIIGDQKYGNKEINCHFAKLGFRRLYLHSYKIILPDSIDAIAICDDQWIKLEKFLGLSQLV